MLYTTATQRTIYTYQIACECRMDIYIDHLNDNKVSIKTCYYWLFKQDFKRFERICKFIYYPLFIIRNNLRMKPVRIPKNCTIKCV